MDIPHYRNVCFLIEKSPNPGHYAAVYLLREVVGRARMRVLGMALSYWCSRGHRLSPHNPKG